MDRKDISRERLEQIADALLDRLYRLEELGVLEFVSELANEGILIEEAEAFGFKFSEADRAEHEVLSGFSDKGTYHLHFETVGSYFLDTTEMFAEDGNDLFELWKEFAKENGLSIGDLHTVEFVTKERI